MRLSLVQLDIALGNPQKNLIKVQNMVRQAMQENPDVIVLPEMWNTGFFPVNVKAIADNNGVLTKSLLSSLAKELHVNIIGGSVANLENDTLVNTNYVFNREGVLISQYNKIHLFSPSGEHKIFSPGTKISLFEIDGVKAAVIICYDLRFTELVRTLALEGIELLFIPAEWPHPRLEHWQTLIKARAIENQMFVAAVNGVGVANSLKFCGNSMIADPWGQVLCLADESEVIISQDIDLDVIKDIRERINIFRDRRPTLYKVN